MINLVDNTTARSFDILLIGKTKQKDIKKSNLSKFRVKKSRNAKVLYFVEKSKYSIDTKGEKKGLTVSKRLKRGKRVVKSKKRIKRTKTKSKRRKITPKRKKKKKVSKKKK